MSELIKQNYELAYHISSNLEEADVQKTRQEVEKYITSNGGVISFVKEPEKARLAYPIEHQMNAFFGHFNFNIESPDGALAQMREELRLNPNVLRFLILKYKLQPKADKEDIIRRLAMAEKRRARTLKQAEKAQKGEVPKADEEVIEKKLEEIIEKL